MGRLDTLRKIRKSLKEFEYDTGCTIENCSCQEEKDRFKNLWRGYSRAVGAVETLITLEEGRLNGNNRSNSK